MTAGVEEIRFDWRRVAAAAGALMAVLLLLGLVFLVAMSNEDRDEALQLERHAYDVTLLTRSVDASISRSEAALGRFALDEDVKTSGNIYLSYWRLAGQQLYQLKRLAATAELPNVTLQVLPFEVGAHAGMDGTFTILSFPEAGDPDVVYAENATGGLFLEKSEELQKYIYIFDHIRAAAMHPDASTAYIAELAEEPLWKSRRRGSVWT